MMRTPSAMVAENLYLFQPKTICIDGNNLSYVDEGQGETVAMLHGNPTWSFFYRRLIIHLKDSYRVIVPDHMGCGLSDKPQDYPYRLINHIENLEMLLKDCRGRVSLIVHDWGGAIGFGYAVRHPEKIKNLIVLNTAAFTSRRIPLRIRLCKIPFLGELLVRGFNGFAFPATFMAVSKKMAKSVRKGFLAPYGNWHDRVAVHRFVKDIPLSMQHPSYKTLMEIEQGLPKLQAKPMLILWGGKDFCFNDSFYQEWLRRFPQADKKYFKEAGHYLLEDAYPAIAPLIEQFLRKHG
jgi:haloalkane dehalogenase